MTDIAFRLASEVLETSGFSCLHAEPATIRGQVTIRVTVASVGRRKAAGIRVWLRSRKQADRTMAELLSSERRSSRYKEDLIVGAELEEVNQLIRCCAHRLGFAVTEDEHLDTTMASLVRRIEAGLETLRKAGDMKKLNREFQAARQARGQSCGDIEGTSGTKGTSYADWLVERLKSRLSLSTTLVQSRVRDN
ncbi:hypothetical protein ACRQ5Q_14830 [Bradyrhizobium sp. PMVTL-01]|uniref:hypothetical protein n=1 Tax=Bradyrhizobium sp. PMVTL-01 TaxID=3434999 RepID=UPI003F70BE6E